MYIRRKRLLRKGVAGVACGLLPLLLLACTVPRAHAAEELARRSWRTVQQHEHAAGQQQCETARREMEQRACVCPGLTASQNSAHSPPSSSLLYSADSLLVSHCLVLALGFWLGRSRGRKQLHQQAAPGPHTVSASSGPAQQQAQAAERTAPEPAHSHCNSTASASSSDAACAHPPAKQPETASPSRNSKQISAQEPASGAASPDVEHMSSSASPLLQLNDKHNNAAGSPNASSTATCKAEASSTDSPGHRLQHKLQCAHQQGRVERSQQAVQESCAEQQQKSQHQLEAQHGEKPQAARQQECTDEQHQGRQGEQGQDEQQAHASHHDQQLPSAHHPSTSSSPPPRHVASPAAPLQEHSTDSNILATSSGNSLARAQNPCTQSWDQQALTTLASQLNLLLSERMAPDKLQIVHHHEHTHSLDPRSYDQAKQLAGELQAMADRCVHSCIRH